MSEKQIRVIIAEDQQILRSGLKLCLGQKSGFEIVGEAVDGSIAVKMSEELHPDLVLLDIGMPVMDGIEAAGKIKSILPHVRIIMLTSRNSDNDVLASLAAGADGYCLKDISEDSLFLAIASVMSGAAWLDPAIAACVLKAIAGKSPPASGDKTKGQEIKFPLSDRELEVLTLVVEGLTNIEIAERLFLSPDTVKTHLKHIMEKLMVSDRTQAAVKAMRQGLVD